MAVAVACLLGLAVTTGVLIWSKRRATPLVASGFAVLLGSAAGGLALWALGGATTLVMIVLPGALALGLTLAIKAAARQFLETLNRDYTTQAWPEVPIPADLESYDNGPDEVFYEQTRAWMRSRHKGLYEALKQGPVVKPEPLVDNAVEITLAERRQQRQAPQEIWTVVPAMPGMGP